MGIMDNRGCLTCHSLEKNRPYLKSYEQDNPWKFASSFGAVKKRTLPDLSHQRRGPSRLLAMPQISRERRRRADHEHENPGSIIARQNMTGGEGGIRTPGTLARTSHFECDAIDHSATSPHARKPVVAPAE